MTESPAQTLRRAAEKARTLASMATEGPWGTGKSGMSVWVESATGDLFVADTGDRGNEFAEADAAFIAAVHPGVMLAVAGMWDAVADGMGDDEVVERGVAGVGVLVLGRLFSPRKTWTAALAAAREFLNEEDQ